jgi:hypothetical protein
MYEIHRLGGSQKTQSILLQQLLSSPGTPSDLGLENNL